MLGTGPFEQFVNAMRQCAAVVCVPILSEEPFGCAAAEAMAAG